MSIQDRIFRELPIEHKDKFRDSLCTVDWEADIVREMIDKRIKHIVDIPHAKIWDGLFPKSGFPFIWSRIGGRPREAIRLASICLETARKNGHSCVSEEDLRVASKVFSNERIEDIGSELGYIYPGFTTFLKCFSGGHKEFPVVKIKDAVDHCILKSHDEPSPSYVWIRGYENAFFDIARVMLENQILLFKRTRKDIPAIYDPAEHDMYDNHAFVAFHPMYVSGLGLISND